MELCFAGSEAGLLYALDGIVFSRTCVDGAINDTERTRTQNRLNPQRTVIDSLAQKPGRGRRIRHCERGFKGKQPSPDFSVLSCLGGLDGRREAIDGWVGEWVVDEE